VKHFCLLAVLLVAACDDPLGPVCAQVVCDPLATCSEASGVARCTCPAGYSDTHGDGTACVALDACAAGTDTCDAHATCTSGAAAGTFSCACEVGYTGNGTTCTACSSCGTGTHETAACSATSDRVCTACTTCSASQYETAACTTTSDRTCATCAAIDHCAATPTCSSAANQRCSACDATYYLVDGTADSCAACSGACPGGEYQSAACGATSDRVCTACTTCTASQYETAACTPTSNRTCAACTAIAHCAAAPSCTSAANQQCSACDATYYLVDGAADSCAPCSVGCPSGQYQSAACAATSDRVCTACTAITHCASAPTCTSAANQQCAACDATFYLVNGTSDSCAACSGACPGGQYQSAACGATSDRVCSACTVCGSGKFQASACTPTSDTVCTACPTHCTSCTDASTCTACDPGYFGATCQSLRADCYDILTHAGSSGDGIYTVDPDGAGGVAGMQVYCDMTNGGWTQLNDQDVALGYLAAATWLAGVSTTAPNGGQWGILNRLSLFENTAGGFEFRLTFGQTQSSTVQWKQSGDPLSGAAGTLSGVAMSPADQMGCSLFLGLSKRSSFAALDGDTLGCWWFAVGSSESYVGPPGIPAYASSAAGQLVTDRARLWVRKNGP
jgi:hypothetical protein